MFDLGFYGGVRNAQRSNWDHIQADAAAKRSAVEVVLDGWQLAPTLAAQQPGRLVVIRQSWDEKASDQHPDGAAWLRTVRGSGYHPSCLLEIENEPAVPKPGEAGRSPWLAWHAGWLLESMIEAERLGVRLCVGNWSTGVPEPEDWLAYQSVLQRVVAGGHYLGMHVYYAVTPTTPITQAMMRNVDAAIRVEPGLFGRIVLTETGKDHVEQLPASPAGWVDNETQDGHADRMLEMFELWRGRGVYGAAEFIDQERFDEDNPTHQRWKNFSIAGKTTYNRRVAEHKYGEWLTMPVDMNDRLSGMVSPAQANWTINIRATPGGEDVGDLVGPIHASRTAGYETTSGHSWRHYIFDDPSGELNAGWMADAVVSWKPDPVTEPLPEPEPLPEATPLEQFRTLIGGMESLVTGWKLDAALALDQMESFRVLLVETKSEIDIKIEAEKAAKAAEKTMEAA